ncbi:MAG: PolC-type DNA polymerase III, partial [Kurthia sp.]
YLDRSFNQIAQIQLAISAENDDVTETLIHDYWQRILEDQDELSPPLRAILSKQLPQLHGQKLVIHCMQEFEQMTLKSKYAQKLAETYEDYGFSKLHFDFQLKEQTEAMEEEQKRFIAQRRIEEEEISKKAVLDMQKREKERQDNPSGVDVSDRPFQLGIPIKNDD